MITQTKIALVAALVLGSTSLAFAQDRAHAPRGDSSTATHYAEIRDGSWNPNTYEGGDWTRAGGAYRTNL
jgi:Spy/CpxP family protein refolding chaperone